ncbi:hypothetical protein PAPYR_5145 [Paratrimastix pyriformis]|uniref:Uncharacterized protein n=1 Tax=Paratrimastix pyriformis TaxID=342808 RepID=A0ABQ8UKX2_9EUKA|nr:hypothetical protein PAPYR_5145 [Paratrimastix pyriformis]
MLDDEETEHYYQEVVKRSQGTLIFALVIEILFSIAILSVGYSVKLDFWWLLVAVILSSLISIPATFRAKIRFALAAIAAHALAILMDAAALVSVSRSYSNVRFRPYVPNLLWMLILCALLAVFMAFAIFLALRVVVGLASARPALPGEEAEAPVERPWTRSLHTRTAAMRAGLPGGRGVRREEVEEAEEDEVAV